MNIFLDLLEEEGVEGDELMNIFLDFLEEDGVEGGEEREYLESPMSDGTIEEDFEEALARYFFYINKPFIIQLVHNNWLFIQWGPEKSGIEKLFKLWL